MADKTIDLSELEAELRSMNIDPATADWTRTSGRTRRLLADETARRFDQERGPDGRFWAALAESTKRRKTNPKKLQEGGLLKAAASSLEATRALRTGEGLTVEQSMGTLPFYGPFQNDGTRDIPARPFFGISEAQADRVTELVADDLAAQVLGRPA
jgi:Phage virion morphogenesis family